MNVIISIKQTLFQKKPIKLEWCYVVLSLFFGLIFIILIPPGWNPDEPQHYWRVQQISSGNFIPDQFESNNRIETGGALPANSANFILSYDGYNALEDHSLRLNFPMWKNSHASTDTTEGGNEVNLNFSGSARYSPVVYAPQAVTIWIAEQLNASLLVGFIIAKVAGLLVQTAAFFWAIRIIPRGKWILFAIALLPSTIVQSTAIGGDVMTTATCTLFIALTLYLAYKERGPRTIEVTAMITLVCLLGLVKPAYLPLCLLLVILPLANPWYRNVKRLLSLGTLSAVAIIPGLIWIKSTSFIVDYFNRPVHPDLQKSYILHQPLEYLGVLMRTYFTEDQPKLLKTLFGNFLWDTAPLPLLIMFVGVIILCLTTFVSSKRELSALKKPLSKSIKAVLLLVFLCMVVIISTGLYLMYTDYKATSILGLQGRYYLPFLSLPLIAFMFTLPYKRQRRVKVTILILLILMQLSAINVIWERIYV